MPRQQHHRVRDHFGRELASVVVIDDAIGRYAARTPVQDVLADLFARLDALESADHVLGTFTLDAWILAPGAVSDGGGGTWIGALALDAVTRVTEAVTFVLDAVLQTGGRFTLDAWLGGHGTFTLDAWIT